MRFLLRLMTLPLLTETDKQNLLNYRYSGGDSSPIYQNILSPFAQFWVDLLPLWMAPNVVTSLGLICSILAAICTAIFNPDLAAHAPRWLHLMSCLCILAYQTFDNMDGKQARRTGSSSPLGMLFDHGCDAVNAGLLCIPIASALATGWTPNFFLCLWSGFAAFYFQAWEEYYVGTMVLPPFNGPTEGLLMSAGTCLLSFFFDSQFWHEVPHTWMASQCSAVTQLLML